MSIKRPDIYEHNNPNYPIVSANNILGCKFVETINDLYTYSTLKLTEGTIIWVNSENLYYVLIDITNANNSTGWKQFKSGNESILFYNNIIDFPLTGDITNLYVSKTTRNIYYWNGTYVCLSSHAYLQDLEYAGENVLYGHINNTTQTIFGDKTFNNNVSILGNLYVYGTEFITNTQTVEIEDNVLLINKGELGDGITAGIGGIEIDRGNYVNYQFIYDESDDLFKIGEVGDLQVVATVTNTPTNNYFGKWNSTNYWFDTVAISSADLTDNSNIAKLNAIQTFIETNTFQKQIISTLISGTAPFSISSTTVVSNLNVDMVDGKHAQSSLTDTTDALMRVGAFGLGFMANATSWNGTITTFVAATTSAPEAYEYYGLSVRGSVNNGLDLAGKNNKFFVRTYNSGTFQNWHQLYHTSNSNLSTIDWLSKNLTVNGTFINNLSSNHIYKQIIIDRTGYNDYDKVVILLHQVYDSSVFNMNYCIGRLILQRGSSTASFRHDVIDINTASAYNNTTGNIEYNLGSTPLIEPKLVTCYYNSIKYMALEIPYVISYYSYEISFDGYIKSTAPEQLILISYYDTQSTGTILNSEIYNSITDFTNTGKKTYTESNSVFKNIYINQSTGSEVLDISGNAKVSGRFISSLVTGTSPLSVVSTTKNTNLNADLLDDLHIGQTGTNYIPYADSSGNVGIGSNPPLAKLDVTGNVLIQSSRTSNVSRTLSIGMFHYNLSEENFIPYGASVTNIDNKITLGGGFGDANAATDISFYTSVNNTTTAGTLRGQINNVGNWGIKQFAGTEALEVTGNIKSTGTLISSIATGTAPLQVTSTTLVTNLNSDKVDGYDVQTSMTDTNDRLMRVGAFGLGGGMISKGIETNIDTAYIPTGFNYYSNGALGTKPNNTIAFTLRMAYNNDALGWEFANTPYTNDFWLRSSTNTSGIWNTWQNIYHTANLTKSVLESLLTGNITSHTHNIYGLLAGDNTWTMNNYFNSSVGIGTTTPLRTLEIVKSSTGIVQQNRINSIDNNVENILKFTISTDNAANIGSELITKRTNEFNSGDSDFIIKVSSSTVLTSRFIVKSTGSVGIGTLTPDSLLTLASNSPVIRLVQTLSNYNHLIDASGNGVLAFKADIAGLAESLSKITFSIADSNKMTIKNSGDVGIGIDEPTAKLTVVDTIVMEIASFKGAGNIIDWNIIGSTGVGEYWQGYFIGSNIKFGTTLPAVNNTGHRASAIGFTNDSSQSRLGFLLTTSTTAGTELTEVGYFTTTGLIVAGNVGIGTTIVPEKLTVAGKVSATTAILTELTANYLPKQTATGLGNSGVYEDVNGNVGIGTIYPIVRLDSRGTIEPISTLSAVPNGSAWFGGVGTGAGLNIGNYGGDYIWLQGRNVLADVGAYPIVINPLGGNVGIGTSSPVNRLEVVGNSTIFTTATNPASTATHKGLTMGYDNNSEHSWIQATRNSSAEVRDLELNPLGGNVGIGTTTISEKLTVAGHVKANGFIGAYLQGNTTSGSFFGDAASAMGGGVTGAIMYAYGANPLLFYIGGAERMSINASGDITMIGNIKATTGIFTNLSDNYVPKQSSDTLGLINSSIFDSGSSIGIGLSSPYIHERVNIQGAYNSLSTAPGSIAVPKYDNILRYAVLSTNTDASGIQGRNEYSSELGSGLRFFTTNTGGTAIYPLELLKNGNSIFNYNVGIGTTSPLSGGAGSNWLTLNGTTTYSGGIIGSINGVAKMYVYSESGFSRIQATSGEGVKLDVNATTTALTALSNGNVGIGTTTPTAKLTVNATNGIAAKFTNNGIDYNNVYFGDSTNRQYSNLVLEADTGTASIWKAGSLYSSYGGASSLNLHNNNGKIAFHPNNISNAVVFDTTGFVGIGIASPQYQLDVFNSADSAIRIKSTGGAGYYIASAPNNKQAGYQFHEGDVNKWFLFKTPTASSDLELYGNTSTMFWQRSTGYVGIGTSSPSAKLNILCDASASITGGLHIDTISSSIRLGGNTTYSWIQSHNGQPLRINELGNNTIINLSSGNVGIGTTTVPEKLTVNGYVKAEGFYNTFKNSNLNSRNSFQSFNLNEATLTIGWIAADFGDTGTTSGRVVLGTGYGKAIIGGHTGTLGDWADLLINPLSGGNVGIGTTSPKNKLHSNGGVFDYTNENTYSALFSNNSNKGVIIGYSDSLNTGFISSINPLVAWTDLILNINGGNVGIGTTTPGTKIDVNGDIRANGVVYASGTGGFASSTYIQNTRNPIWRFGNSDAYGFSYFQGTSSLGGGSSDTLGFHFGTATASASLLQINTNYISIGMPNESVTEKLTVNGNIAFGTNGTCKIVHNTTTSSIDFIII